MSMTREEIIEAYEDAVKSYELFKAGLEALRPITREQVEKTKAMFFQPCIEDVARDSYRCSHCYVQEFGDIRGINFCPSCGAPLTDEAVDMVMERLEALKDGNTD